MTWLSGMYGARAQVALGALLTLGGVVAWPVTAATVFRDEPQGVLGLSWFALILAGYNLVATGLGYRATERVESQVAEVAHADTVKADHAEVK